jgi:UDP-N-acetylmuramoylalanine--D-glutamate ligase
MIVIYGKWKVGTWLDMLLTYVDIDHVLMDDADRSDEILTQSEYVIMSPGIKPSHDVYLLYWKKVLSELSYLGILMKKITLPKITFIGITWTNGKSTTSWIMYQALQKLLPSVQIWLTWNFDVPLSHTLLSIMKEWSDKEHICVVESSSFMLYNLKNFIFDYAIWLNIARDHLDRHETMENYIDAKKAICENARHCFVAHTLYVMLPRYLQRRSTIIPQTVDISYTQFLWKHNMHNMAAVMSCLQQLSEERSVSLDMEKVFSSVQPLPHRIQTISTIAWVRIVDDGISTSAQSLLAGLHAMDAKCVLIVGGYDKWDDYSILRSTFASKVGYAVCLGQNKYIFADIAKNVWIPYVLSDTLDHAVHTAMDAAKRFDFSIVLYSPGSASFDMFVNVYDRVEQFNQIVAWLAR